MNMISVRLDQNAAKPLYTQLYEFIRSEIITGKYPYNTKLPSKRRLSAHLQCSQNTVQNAYGQLTAEGYIVSKPKSGFYVCAVDGILNINTKPVLSGEPADKSELYRYDFSYNGVDLENFPFSIWRRLTKEVISEYDTGLLKIGHTQGLYALRESINRYLHESRGVNCSPQQIIISSGTEFLFQLIIQLLNADTLYALENPGYEKLNMVFKSSRARYSAVAVDESGIILEELNKSGADVVCVTPSHQFPTGCIMPAGRRLALLKWANEKSDRYIIEDDYDSEFKYGGKPIPSLQSLDSGGRVVYMGAFSKSLSPSMRVSYMVLPEPLLKAYYEKLTFYICPVPAVEQKALCRFINEGYFERHLNKMRNIYKKKREFLVSAIHRLLPYAAVKGANAGLHLLLEIDNGMNERQLTEAARECGVKVYGLSQYYIGESKDLTPPRVLLGYAALTEEETAEAAALLAKAWGQAAEKNEAQSV